MSTSNEPTVQVGTAGASGPELERGTAVGRYVILDEIGRGGMGVVYAAYDPDLDRRIALKVVSHDSPESSTEQWVSEAQALARLEHPNVVTVHDVLVVDGRICIAMQFVEGTTVRQWLSAETRSWPDILKVFVAAGRGLAAAHAAGLVHRDVKPDNLMVGAGNRVVLMDFGIALERAPKARRNAKPRRESAEDRTTLGDYILGTPKYMPPEQWVGLIVDARSDQFSLCCCLYEALYDRMPFDEPEGPDPKTRKSVLPAPPESPVPSQIWRALHKGLAADANDRFESMDGLLRALDLEPARAASRRRLTAVGAVVVVAGFAAVAYDSGPCAASGTSFQAIWDEDIAGRLQAAFHETGLPYADTTWATTRAQLDAHAADWVEMRRDACEATHVRREQSEAVLDLRMACLDRSRVQFESLLEVLREPTREMVDRAPQMATRLHALDGCADVDALSAPIAPPSASDVVTVREVRERLVRAQTLVTASDYDGARSAMESIEAKSNELAYPPLLAEVVAERGRLLLAEGKFDEAEATLMDAQAHAIRGRHDDAFARITIKLADLIGFRRTRMAEGNTWAKVAGAAIDRMGDRADLRRLLWYAQANIHIAEGRYEDARALRQRIYDAVVDEYGPEDLRTVYALGRLAHSLYELGQHKEALAHDRQVLAIRRQRLGPGHPNVAVSHTALGLNLAGIGQLEEGLAELERSLEIVVAVHGLEHPNVAHTMNNIANAKVSLGRMSAARADYERAVEIWTQTLGPGEPRLGVAHANIGRTHWYEGNVEDARAAYARGRDILTAASGPRSRYLTGPLLGLARAHYALGDYDETEAVLEEVVESLEGGDESLAGAYAVAHRLRGDIRRSLSDCEGAVEFYRRAVSLRPDGLTAMYAKTGLASCELDAGNVKKATAAIEEALSIQENSTWRDDPVPRALTELEHARILDAAGQSDRANSIAGPALEVLARSGGRTERDHRRWKSWLAKLGR